MGEEIRKLFQKELELIITKEARTLPKGEPLVLKIELGVNNIGLREEEVVRIYVGIHSSVPQDKTRQIIDKVSNYLSKEGYRVSSTLRMEVCEDDANWEAFIFEIPTSFMMSWLIH
jgi:hypothetical protein